MDRSIQALTNASLLYTRANASSAMDPTNQSRPHIYKAIGIVLAFASGIFIGVSFVLKKIGLLKANEAYGEAAGEGYGYLKNSYWWAGMFLMIIGEVCNFVAYAFVDAILVTPLGAMSVVITTVLSAIFLKERLSMVGKVGCFLCIIGSVIIVMNAPAESSVANIQEMQKFVIAPGFLTYASVIILGCLFVAIWIAPLYGKKTMMVYLSICSLVGSLSVVATQGLGAAIVAQIGGTSQFRQWFLYVLLAFVISTLVTEVIYLNKALNIFNAALVTPTYYVFFTSSTIITSAILFRGFSGSVTSIITVVNGFLVICAGVVLLQLSKSAKDVPDTAVFTGDLDQVRTIAEQEQPESEPKADAIRGTAAIVRKISDSRQKWELQEAKRLHEEKKQDLRAIGENNHLAVQWDGLRRRTTTHSIILQSPNLSIGQSGRNLSSPTLHPPLGMSHFPPEDGPDHESEVPRTGGLGSSIFGVRLLDGKVKFGPYRSSTINQINHEIPQQTIPLSEIAIHDSQGQDNCVCHDEERSADQSLLGLPKSLKPESSSNHNKHKFEDCQDDSRDSILNISPNPSLQSKGRQFSFQSIFRKVSTPSSNLSPETPTYMRSQTTKRSSSNRRGSTSTVKGADVEEESLALVNSNSSNNNSQKPPPKFRDEEKQADSEITTNNQKEYCEEGWKKEPFNTLDDISEEELYEINRKKWKIVEEK
ncbi:NIPA-like protein 2 [Erysiphe neolycopersici]|uniref:NIPA-like protein 2 n=1 Tax=Erysiphe neolycopersici TaxID=212602 RepID=A0A420HX81_9PEZI|nr:NIPA-like protein 2 [Erysiphe neolycopersici]